MTSIQDPGARRRVARQAGVACAICAVCACDWGGAAMTSMNKTSENDGQYKRASAAGVTFEWRIDGDALEGRMSARTLGWVTIGFNRARTLDGTRLVMGYVDRG